MCLVARLIVGCVQIVHAASQAGIHYRQVLIRQRKIDAQLRTEVAEQSLQLLYVISIHLCRRDIHVLAYAFGIQAFYDFVTLLLTTACYHEVAEHVFVLCYLVSTYGGYTTCSYHYYSCHFTLYLFCSFVRLS